jgi:hypothetical protein
VTVGIEANLPIHSDWKFIGKPFLLGTVALGGAINILPVTFSKIRSKREVRIILKKQFSILGYFKISMVEYWCSFPGLVFEYCLVLLCFENCSPKRRRR